MYLLNLTFLQFAAIFGAISALALALYLLDRSRRRIVVSTLAFWTEATQPAIAARRKRIHQPWSLILQLLSIALLLLAIAQLRIGSRAAPGRDHVLLLDTSAWMAARSGDGSLMDQARRKALEYVRAIPPADRIMLVRADALATPATGFENDRPNLEAAISASKAGGTALDMNQAIAFARHMLAQAGRTPGEIVFAGAGRVASSDPGTPDYSGRSLRVLQVDDSAANCGIRKVGARRSADDPSTWDVLITVRNYGPDSRISTVTLRPAGAGSGVSDSQRIEIGPESERELVFHYRSASAAGIRVEISPSDDFRADDSAELELPAQPSLKMVVYTADPERLKPVLASNPFVTAEFRSPSAYRPDDSGLVVIDSFTPPSRPVADSIWIDPPAEGSPARILRSVSGVRIVRWQREHPIAAGLRTRDLKLLKTSIFEADSGTVPIGETESGPAIVALSGNRKTVVFGFHPAAPGLKYELATPLLFANIERWVSPEMFRRREVSGVSLGMVRLPLRDDVQASDVDVRTASGATIPFTVRKGELRFFAGSPDRVRVTSGDAEYAYSLSLPQLWDAKWQAPAEAAKGIPSFKPALDSSVELWPWLAIAGVAGLLIEWLLFGRGRSSRARFPLRIHMRRRTSRVAETRS